MNVQSSVSLSNSSFYQFLCEYVTAHLSNCDVKKVPKSNCVSSKKTNHIACHLHIITATRLQLFLGWQCDRKWKLFAVKFFLLKIQNKVSKCPNFIIFTCRTQVLKPWLTPHPHPPEPALLCPLFFSSRLVCLVQA